MQQNVPETHPVGCVPTLSLLLAHVWKGLSVFGGSVQVISVAGSEPPLRSPLPATRHRTRLQPDWGRGLEGRAQHKTFVFVGVSGLRLMLVGQVSARLGTGCFWKHLWPPHGPTFSAIPSN